MLVRLEHHTRYDYEKPVSFSPHFVRLFPRTEPRPPRSETPFCHESRRQRPVPPRSFRQQFCPLFLPGKRVCLTLRLQLGNRTSGAESLRLPARKRCRRLPLYLRRDHRCPRLAPYLSPPPADSGQVGGPSLLPLTFWEKPSTPTPTVSVILGLMDAIHTHVRYERRDEGAAPSPRRNPPPRPRLLPRFWRPARQPPARTRPRGPPRQRLPVRIRREHRRPPRGRRDAPLGPRFICPARVGPASTRPTASSATTISLPPPLA